MSAALICTVCALTGACDKCSAMGYVPTKSTRRATVSRTSKTRDYRRTSCARRTSARTLELMEKRAAHRRIRHASVDVPVCKDIEVLKNVRAYNSERGYITLCYVAVEAYTYA
jgi:hypothetical protein